MHSLCIREPTPHALSEVPGQGPVHLVGRRRGRLQQIGARLKRAGMRWTVAGANLLDDYGQQELAAAVNVALERDALGAGSITHILETRRRQRGLKPPLRLTLPDRPGLRDLDVRSHDLESYDALGQNSPDDAGD